MVLATASRDPLRDATFVQHVCRGIRGANALMTINPHRSSIRCLVFLVRIRGNISVRRDVTSHVTVSSLLANFWPQLARCSSSLSFKREDQHDSLVMSSRDIFQTATEVVFHLQAYKVCHSIQNMRQPNPTSRCHRWRAYDHHKARASGVQNEETHHTSMGPCHKGTSKGAFGGTLVPRRGHRDKRSTRRTASSGLGPAVSSYHHSAIAMPEPG